MINLLILTLCGVFSTLLKEKGRTFLTPLIAFIAFCFSCFLTYSFLKDGSLNQVLKIDIAFISLNFGIDLLSLVFVNLVFMLWGLASVYSYSYLKTNYPEKSDTLFQFCYSFAILCAILFALARDVLTMFIVYELLTISTIPLVGFKKNEETKRGLFRYVTVLFGCSLAFLLPATLFTIAKTGIVLFDGNGFIGNFELSNSSLKLLLLFFILGIGKCAFFPFHIWLPSAMVAPTPVSGLLHAVAVVKVGAFFVLKVVVDVFGIELLKNLLSDFNFLMYLSGFTIIFASVSAVFQSNLKKRLAYSTIAQISYIVLSLSTFTKLGVFVAMFQIISHAVAKILLFFAVGGFYTSAHSNQIVDFTGMYQRNKIASLAFAFASFSLCGVPFTIGFLNKGLLFYNVIQAHYYFAGFVLFVSAFLSFVYLMPVCYTVLKTTPQNHIQHYSKIPLTFDFVFCFLFLVNIILFFVSGLFFINYVNEW